MWRLLVAGILAESWSMFVYSISVKCLVWNSFASWSQPAVLFAWAFTRYVHLHLQGNLTYEAEGIYPADYFFAINPVSGVIRVVNDLKTDELSRATYEVCFFPLPFLSVQILDILFYSSFCCSFPLLFNLFFNFKNDFSNRRLVRCLLHKKPNFSLTKKKKKRKGMKQSPNQKMQNDFKSMGDTKSAQCYIWDGVNHRLCTCLFILFLVFYFISVTLHKISSIWLSICVVMEERCAGLRWNMWSKTFFLCFSASNLCIRQRVPWPACNLHGDHQYCPQPQHSSHSGLLPDHSPWDMGFWWPHLQHQRLWRWRGE